MYEYYELLLAKLRWHEFSEPEDWVWPRPQRIAAFRCIDRSRKAKEQSEQSILCQDFEWLQNASNMSQKRNHMPGSAPDGLFAQADRNPILALPPLQTLIANMRSLPQRPQVLVLCHAMSK